MKNIILNTKHIRNILKDNELNESTLCSKMEHVGSTGQKYETQIYNLDVILAVGYRTNSSNVGWAKRSVPTLRYFQKHRSY